MSPSFYQFRKLKNPPSFLSFHAGSGHKFDTGTDSKPPKGGLIPVVTSWAGPVLLDEHSGPLWVLCTHVVVLATFGVSIATVRFTLKVGGSARCRDRSTPWSVL